MPPMPMHQVSIAAKRHMHSVVVSNGIWVAQCLQNNVCGFVKCNAWWDLGGTHKNK